MREALLLDVSAEQEAQMQQFFESQIARASPVASRPNNYVLPDEYSFTTNNCATSIVDALQAGLPWYLDLLLSGTLAPVALEVRLDSVAAPLVSYDTRYSTRPRPPRIPLPNR